MEQAQPDAVPAERVDERDLGLVKLPGRGEVAAILVAVGIAQHHFLDVAARGEDAAVFGQREQPLHHAATLTEIVDGLEQGDDVDIEFPRVRPQQADVLQQQGHFENVGHAAGHGDDVMGNGGGAILPMPNGRRAHDGELGCRLVGIGEMRRRERAGRAHLADQKREASVLAERCIAGGGACRLEQLGRPPADARPSSGASRWARGGSRRHRPRAATAAIARARDRRAIGAQGIVDYVEVAQEFARIRVGRRRSDRMARRFELVERPCGRRKPRINAGDGAAVRLVLALRRAVRRSVRQLPQLLETPTMRPSSDSSPPSR